MEAATPGGCDSLSGLFTSAELTRRVGPVVVVHCWCYPGNDESVPTMVSWLNSLDLFGKAAGLR
jgi:hypothetical protein